MSILTDPFVRRFKIGYWIVVILILLVAIGLYVVGHPAAWFFAMVGGVMAWPSRYDPAIWLKERNERRRFRWRDECDFLNGRTPPDIK